MTTGPDDRPASWYLASLVEPAPVCPDCGHRHAGVALGQICVGCPCLSVPAIVGRPMCACVDGCAAHAGERPVSHDGRPAECPVLAPAYVDRLIERWRAER